MALISMKKLNTEEALSIFNSNEWELSKGVYSCPCFKRNKETGEVMQLPDKVKVDYFIHMKGNASLNRRHIQQGAAKTIASVLGMRLQDVKEVLNY